MIQAEEKGSGDAGILIGQFYANSEQYEDALYFFRRAKEVGEKEADKYIVETEKKLQQKLAAIIASGKETSANDGVGRWEASIQTQSDSGTDWLLSIVKKVLPILIVGYAIRSGLPKYKASKQGLQQETGHAAHIAGELPKKAGGAAVPIGSQWKAAHPLAWAPEPELAGTERRIEYRDRFMGSAVTFSPILWVGPVGMCVITICFLLIGNWLVAGLCAVGFAGVYSLVHFLKSKDAWERHLVQKGIVVEGRIRSADGDVIQDKSLRMMGVGVRRDRVEYEFVWHGRVYKKTAERNRFQEASEAAEERSLIEGAFVTVLLDPEKPERSMLYTCSSYRAVA